MGRVMQWHAPTAAATLDVLARLLEREFANCRGIPDGYVSFHSERGRLTVRVGPRDADFEFIPGRGLVCLGGGTFLGSAPDPNIIDAGEDRRQLPQPMGEFL